MLKPKIGIMGVGWVGGQLKKYLEEVKGYKPGIDLFLYTKHKEKCVGDIEDAEIIFVALPTPRNPKNGSCDISIVEEAISKIKSKKIIVIKSTVAPGTTAMLQKKYKKYIFLFNPEFLTEANAWEDMLHPDRQIVGFLGKNKQAAELVLSLLPSAPLMSPGIYGDRELKISATEAEIIKYAGNIFLARKINWANALAISTEHLGGNYNNVRIGFGADKRIGP